MILCDTKQSLNSRRHYLIAPLRVLHFGILGWGVVGWVVPFNAWLIAYLFAMPLIALQWLLNRNSCLLNNLESYIATGRWRDQGDPEQGGFIAGIIERISGRRLSAAAINAISYGLLAVFWLFAAAHLYLRGG